MQQAAKCRIAKYRGAANFVRSAKADAPKIFKLILFPGTAGVTAILLIIPSSMDDVSYRRHAAIVRSAVSSILPRILTTSALSLLLRGSERGVASGLEQSPFFGRLRGMRDRDVIGLISRMSRDGFHVETRSEGVVLLSQRVDL